ATRAHQRVAEPAGAQVCFETGMQSWEVEENGIALQLNDGSRIAARELVLALGPWIQETLVALGISLRVQRNVQVWFAPRLQAYAAPDFPAFLVDRADLPAPLYGFPDFGEGVKAAFHGAGSLTDPQHLDREVHPSEDVDPLVRAMEDWMPGAAGTLLDAKPCMYSLTPDEDFIIDRHPAHANVLLCGGFSGHGFKFAPVIGEIAADLLLEGGTRHQIDFLSLTRFRGREA
ncbi:MAG: FAD-dependent oxidoreductase, partial [Chthoniobacterales bacterium]|nr:FAD-dependent oxidoreductase [Chthoniobacterales bacterium]